MFGRIKLNYIPYKLPYAGKTYLPVIYGPSGKPTIVPEHYKTATQAVERAAFLQSKADKIRDRPNSGEFLDVSRDQRYKVALKMIEMGLMEDINDDDLPTEEEADKILQEAGLDPEEVKNRGVEFIKSMKAKYHIVDDEV